MLNVITSVLIPDTHSRSLWSPAGPSRPFLHRTHGHPRAVERPSTGRRKSKNVEPTTLQDGHNMERVKAWLREPEYAPVEGEAPQEDQDNTPDPQSETPFSWIEYSIFLLLGVSMLWAWNMFLAAGPYFQRRFESNQRVLDNFQAAELSVSTVANLGSMWLLTKMQATASYPKRIVASLVINMVVFVLLALSTRLALNVSAQAYFAFLIVTVFATSLATGLCQNGIFAFSSGFGQSKYTQAIMTGQGVAGVLPCIAQIVLVLSVRSGDHDKDDIPAEGPPTPGRAAFAYFLTATGISALTLVAFLYLLRRNATRKAKQASLSGATEDASEPERKTVPLLTLFRKLAWLAGAVFFTFAITMTFPVYTQQIISTVPSDEASPILQPASFIPLAFLFWNSGDLIGRLLTAWPLLSLVRRPKTVFVLAIVRVVWIPLYMLCNVRGEGQLVGGDFFYLVVVQLLFGITNGFLGSTCMIGAGEWVDPDEREAAGGFMGLCLVFGLAVGSLLSFTISGG